MDTSTSEEHIEAVHSILKTPKYSKINKKRGTEEALNLYFSSKKFMKIPLVWKFVQESVQSSCEEATESPDDLKDYMDSQGNIIIARMNEVKDGIIQKLMFSLYFTKDKKLKEVV
jgi:hypothetical protein